MMKLLDAFISYGRADSKDFAIKLQSQLEENGFQVWFDFNDIPLGVDFQNQIDDGIEKASHFLYLISPHSVNSPYCLKEVELAIRLNKRIIPLLHVEKITQETWQQRNPNGTPEQWESYQEQGRHSSFPNMHPAIGKINWVYFREGIDDFDKSLSDLIALMRTHGDYVHRHTQFLVKALEWERHQKQTHYLLIGEEKQEAKDWLKIHFKNEQPPCVPSDLHCEYITESIKNGNNLMTQVFLSYPTEERETMEKIRNSLRRESITVWTKTTDIQTGEAFGEAIERGIEQADNLVYLLSPDSIESTYCQKELELAVSLHKRIIPILVRETDPELVPSALRELQYIDLTDNVREEDYLLDESQLLKILNQDAAYYNEHKVLLTKALKWKRQNENPSILLRGYNLRSAEAWLKVAQKRTQHPPTPLQEEFITQSLHQPPLESLDVFVSYSRADSDFARELNDRLQMQGKTTWFDQESIASGSDFQQEIYRGIKACDNFLFVLSPQSVNSPYCADEVEYAASLNKRFVTVRYRQVNPADLHPELAKVQWIDFHQNDGDFNASFNPLVRTLDTDREHVHSHTKWLQRALEWEQKGRSDDLLLRGREFAVAQNWLSETEEQQKKPAAVALQQELIEASQNAIAAAEEEEKRRQAEMLRLQEERTQEAEARLAEQQKSAKRQKFFLAAVSVALVAAVGVSVVAVVQWRRAAKVTEGQIDALSRFARMLNRSERRFDALLEGIRAGVLLKTLSEIKPEFQEPIVSALQAAVYAEGWREDNRLIPHEDEVTDVVFSPDGKTLATASADKTVKLWNRQGELLHTLNHEDEVTDVVFSPDSQTLATAGWGNTAKLWSQQGELLHSLEGHQAQVYSVVFSPNGQTLATASADKTVKLWNRQGELVHTLNHEEQVYSVVFSPDGQTLATASADKTVKLWSQQGELLHSLEGHQRSVSKVVFSPDGQTLASASYDNTAKLWDREGELLHTLNHQDSVSTVVFSPDGETLATASWDKTAKLWDREGELLHTLNHEDSVDSVVFSPDGQTLATASWDKTAKLWDREGELLHTLNHEDSVDSVVFSPDGETLATASDDNIVKLWNREEELLHTLEGPEYALSGVAFSPDGQTFATPSWGTVKLWSREGKLLHSLEGHQDLVVGIAFSSDGQILATASYDKTAKLWDREGELLHTLNHENPVRDIVFSPDGQTLATASWDTVKLWSREGELLHTLNHEDSVDSVVFSPDDQTLATFSRDTVKLWSREGELLHTLNPEDGVLDVVFSRDGQTLATAWGDTAKLWSREGKLLQTLEGHQHLVVGIAFSSDGQTLVSASYDKTVKLWNREGELLKTLKGHEDKVSDIAFSPDGQTIASASRTVKLWSLEGELLQTLEGHQAWVYSVVFSPDGDLLATTSADNRAILWNLADFTFEKLMRDACDRVENYLQHNAPERDRNLCQDFEE